MKLTKRDKFLYPVTSFAPTNPEHVCDLEVTTVIKTDFEGVMMHPESFDIDDVTLNGMSVWALIQTIAEDEAAEIEAAAKDRANDMYGDKTRNEFEESLNKVMANQVFDPFAEVVRITDHYAASIRKQNHV